MVDVLPVIKDPPPIYEVFPVLVESSLFFFRDGFIIKAGLEKELGFYWIGLGCLTSSAKGYYY